MPQAPGDGWNSEGLAPSIFACPVTKQPFQGGGKGIPIQLQCGHAVSRQGLVDLCTRFVFEGRDIISSTPEHGMARGAIEGDSYTLDCPRCRQPTVLSQMWLHELQAVPAPSSNWLAPKSWTKRFEFTSTLRRARRPSSPSPPTFTRAALTNSKWISDWSDTPLALPFPPTWHPHRA